MLANVKSQPPTNPKETILKQMYCASACSQETTSKLKNSPTFKVQPPTKMEFNYFSLPLSFPISPPLVQFNTSHIIPQTLRPRASRAGDHPIIYPQRLPRIGPCGARGRSRQISHFITRPAIPDWSKSMPGNSRRPPSLRLSSPPPSFILPLPARQYLPSIFFGPSPSCSLSPLAVHHYSYQPPRVRCHH